MKIRPVIFRPAFLHALSQALTVAFFLLCTGCSRPLPDNLHSILIDWYLFPTEAKKQNLSIYKIAPHQMDSLFAAARQQNPAGRSTHSLALRDSLDTEYTLGIFIPDSLQDGQRYPCIVYLHGGTGTHVNTKGEKAYEMLVPLADSVPLFIASPSSNRDAPWWGPRGLSRILQTIRYMNLHYPIDPDRIILAGVSDGATGCYAAANAINAPFAGFIAVSGFGGMLPRLGVPLSAGNLMQRPIYNVNAGMDRIYPIEHVNRFLDQLESQGIGIDRKVYPDEEHGFDYRDREIPYLVSLVRAWRRPSRNSISWTFLPSGPNLCDNILALIPESASRQPAGIAAFIKSDTVRIRSQGILHAELFFASRKCLPALSGPAEKKASISCSEASHTTHVLLNFVMHSCSPHITVPAIYDIDF